MTAGLEPKALKDSAPAPHVPAAGGGVQRLTAGCEAPALDFLARRPAHTAYLAGLIHANGLESPANRGEFYAYRNREQAIEGIALVGHAATFESASAAATHALGRRASRHAETVLIRGERGQVENFWLHYVERGRAAELTCRELLLELNGPAGPCAAGYELRPAVDGELEQVVAMNSALLLDERGSDPLKLDPEGFRERTLRRIRRGQVWVWAPRGAVIFKAEIIARTPEVVYLEGVFVRRDERGKGHGLNAMRRLSHLLLQDARSVCLFVNEGNGAAQALYRKVGYRPAGRYDTIYLRRPQAVATNAFP